MASRLNCCGGPARRCGRSSYKPTGFNVHSSVAPSTSAVLCRLSSVYFQTLSPPQRPPGPLEHSLPVPVPPALATPSSLLPVSVDLPVPDMPCKWAHTLRPFVSGPFHSASCFELVHVAAVVRSSVLPMVGGRSTVGPDHALCLSIVCRWTFGSFPRLGCGGQRARNTRVQAFELCFQSFGVQTRRGVAGSCGNLQLGSAGGAPLLSQSRVCLLVAEPLQLCGFVLTMELPPPPSPFGSPPVWVFESKVCLLQTAYSCIICFGGPFCHFLPVDCATYPFIFNYF